MSRRDYIDSVCEEAYERGEEAYVSSLPADSNPYPFGSHPAAFWDRGWHNAQNTDPNAGRPVRSW